MRNVQEVIESFFEQFSLEEINLQNVNFCFFETYYKNKNSYVMIMTMVIYFTK